MSYLKCGGNFIACPSLIGVTSGGGVTPITTIALFDFNITTGAQASAYFRMSGRPLGWKMM